MMVVRQVHHERSENRSICDATLFQHVRQCHIEAADNAAIPDPFTSGAYNLLQPGL